MGVLGGLAVLAKLNGGLGLMVVWTWLTLSVAAIPMRTRDHILSVVASIGIGVVALATFVALNPFVTAHPRSLAGVALLEPVPADQSPTQRLAKVVTHRVQVSRDAAGSFPNDALTTPWAKLSALAVQGFGRFGPFGPSHSDSTRRFDLSQDWGAILWLPLVVGGLAVAMRSGRTAHRAGVFPGSWALAVLFVVSFATVGAFLPLAWDRYFLSIQAGSALLVALLAVRALDGVRKGTP